MVLAPLSEWLSQTANTPPGHQAALLSYAGFGSFDAVARFCTAHDELRDYLRSRTRFNEAVSLADQRRLFQGRWGEVCALLQAA